MLKRTKTSLWIHGLIMLAISILCFATPSGTLKSIAWILGLLFIAGGVVTFFLGRNRDAVGTDTLHLIAAILMVAVGLIIILRPNIIAILMGLFVLLEGIDFVGQSIRYRKAGLSQWSALLIVGALAIILGLWAVLSPWVGATMLSIIIGVGCLGVAADCFMALIGIKKVQEFFAPIKNQLRENQEFTDAVEVK